MHLDGASGSGFASHRLSNISPSTKPAPAGTIWSEPVKSACTSRATSRIRKLICRLYSILKGTRPHSGADRLGVGS